MTPSDPTRRCSAIWNGCKCGRPPHEDGRHVWMNTLDNNRAVDPALYPLAALSTQPPSLDVERLARALAITEVGCWANKPVHGPDQDAEIHRRDAEAIAHEYARSDE